MLAFMQIVVCPFSAALASFGHWIRLHSAKIVFAGHFTKPESSVARLFRSKSR
jgi:hypothetical protein